MFPVRRRSEIAAFIQQNGGVDTDTLAKHFGISAMTARRDLKILEQENLLRRTWGGAIPPHFIPHEIPYANKAATMLEAKKAIAAKALEIIEDESCIILDAGTTTLALATLLRNRTLTVITQDLQIALLLASSPTVTVYFAGGYVDPVSRSCNDPSAVKYLQQINATVTFVGTSVWDVSCGATTSSTAKMYMKKQLMACAEQCILLADSSKFGTFSPWAVGTLSAFSCIISDSGLSHKAQESIAEAGGVLHMASLSPEKGKDDPKHMDAL